MFNSLGLIHVLFLPAYQGSQWKKSKVTKSNRNSNNGHNNSGTGGSQPRQNNDDSPNMDTSTEQTNCTVSTKTFILILLFVL